MIVNILCNGYSSQSVKPNYYTMSEDRRQVPLEFSFGSTYNAKGIRSAI